MMRALSKQFLIVDFLNDFIYAVLNLQNANTDGHYEYSMKKATTSHLVNQQQSLKVHAVDFGMF